MIIRTSKDSVILDAKLDLATFKEFQDIASKMYPHDTLRNAMNHAIEEFIKRHSRPMAEVPGSLRTATMFAAMNLYKGLRLPHMPSFDELARQPKRSLGERIIYAKHLAGDLPRPDFTKEQASSFEDAVVFILGEMARLP